MIYEGKAVVVTGTSSGIGRAMAMAFAREGAVVGMIARRLERLRALESEIRASGGHAVGFGADVADASAMQSALDSFLRHAGRLDVLVNNAAIGVFGREPTPEEYRNIFEVNVHAVYRASQWAVPHLAKTRGVMLHIGSAVTERPFAGELVYAATKGALTALTRAMAVTYGKDGIRVNMLQPGVIASEFNVAAGIPPEADREAYAASVHLNALDLTGTPEDAAEAALFLCSERAKFVTGEVFKVDGGMTLAGIRA